MPDDQPPGPPPIQPPPPSVNPDSEARTWNMWCHLSILSGFFIPFGNLLGPFLVWQMKKNEIPSVEAHAKAALNFQLTVLIALVVGSVVAFVTSFFCMGYLFFPVVGVIAICGIIFPIIAGVKANGGEVYKYPYSIEFLK